MFGHAAACLTKNSRDIVAGVFIVIIFSVPGSVP